MTVDHAPYPLRGRATPDAARRRRPRVAGAASRSSDASQLDVLAIEVLRRRILPLVFAIQATSYEPGFPIAPAIGGGP